MCRISTPRRLPKPSPVPHWLPSPVATTPRRWSTAQPSRHRSVPRTARGGPPPALTATSGQFAAGYWTWYGQYGQALHNPNIDATPHTCRRCTVSVDSIGKDTHGDRRQPGRLDARQRAAGSATGAGHRRRPVDQRPDRAAVRTARSGGLSRGRDVRPGGGSGAAPLRADPPPPRQVPPLRADHAQTRVARRAGTYVLA